MTVDDHARKPPLNGWKEIAAHLGKSVRSVQRWEATLGLPVRRIRTAEGQIVYADRDEIDDWRRRLDTPPVPEPQDPQDPESIPEPAADTTTHAAASVDASPAALTSVASGPASLTPGSRQGRSALLAAGGLGLFVLGLLTGWGLARPSPIAVNVAVTGQWLQGLNDSGAVVWTYRFDRDVSQPTSSVPGPMLLDVDGDREAEWLVPVRFSLAGTFSGTSDAIFLFTRGGSLRWSVQPAQSLTYPNRTTSAPWRMTDFAVSPGAPRRIWAAFAHHTGASSFILEIDPNGSSSMRYFQYGTIHSVAHWTTPGGSFLAAGGLSVEHARPSLALMPENGPPASMPAEDPRRASCLECPADRPTRLLLFPHSELTTAAHELYAHVLNLRGVGPALEVMTSQGQGHALFVVEPDFSVGSWQMMNTYWGAHKELELKGRLDHTAEQCPDRLTAKVIREWTASVGWKDETVLPGPRGTGLANATRSPSAPAATAAVYSPAP